MEYQFVKQQVCDVCEALPVAESISGAPGEGHRESRVFACGRQIVHGKYLEERVCRTVDQGIARSVLTLCGDAPESSYVNRLKQQAEGVLRQDA